MQRSKFVCRTYHNPAWHLEVVRQYIPPPLWRHKCYSVNQACAKWACLGVHLIVTTELGPIFSANDHRAIALFNLWVLVEKQISDALTCLQWQVNPFFQRSAIPPIYSYHFLSCLFPIPGNCVQFILLPRRLIYLYSFLWVHITLISNS